MLAAHALLALSLIAHEVDPRAYLNATHMSACRFVVAAIALVGITTALLVNMMGQSRIWTMAAREHMIPGFWAKVSPRLWHARGRADHHGRRLRCHTCHADALLQLCAGYCQDHHIHPQVHALLASAYALLKAAVGGLLEPTLRAGLERSDQCCHCPGAAIIGFFTSLDILANMVSIGTLFAFYMVAMSLL